MLMTFGEAMNMLLKKKGLSATNAAQDLGFKSRTAFFRILHDESRLPAIEKCFDSAKQSALLALSQAEIAMLSEAVSVSRHGKKEYGIHRVLHQMISPAPNDQTEHNLQIVGMDGIETVEDVIALLPAGGRVNIMMAGQIGKYLIDRIHRLTQERKVNEIIHLFAIDEEDADDVKIFSRISDILFSDIYSAYYLNETGKSKKNWWLRSGVIMFDHEDDSGKKTTVQLTWLNKNRYFCLAAENDSGALFWKTLFANHDEEMLPLKQEDKTDLQAEMSSYVEFTRKYQQLEQNREIYSLKPDFPMYCVPVEILAQPVIDAFAQQYPDNVENFEAQVSKLYQIHQQRVNNLYTKKRVTHIVLNVEAMWSFVKTGVRSDHFFKTRPYTIAERVQVLTLLRDQARENPYFHIWMSNNPDVISDREVTVYDGFGVALVKGDTSWQLDADHQEVLLESKMLAQYFKTYFTNNLLTNSVMTKEESVTLLDAMILSLNEV